MKLSEERISYLAQRIRNRLQEDGVVLEELGEQAHREIKKGVIDFLKVEEEADLIAREKVASLKRGVMEGSREWDVLYRKYFEEELTKKGR